jgi:hypothetical protein
VVPARNASHLQLLEHDEAVGGAELAQDNGRCGRRREAWDFASESGHL